MYKEVVGVSASKRSHLVLWYRVMVFVPASDSYLEPGGHASQTLKEHILYGLMTP